MTKPKQGEIIFLDFSPTKGHEQSGYRPALVVSNAEFSAASNLILVCPITRTNRKSVLDVPLTETETIGYILCDHVKSIDLNSRRYKPTGESVTKETLLEVIDTVQGALDVLPENEKT